MNSISVFDSLRLIESDTIREELIGQLNGNRSCRGTEAGDVMKLEKGHETVISVIMPALDEERHLRETMVPPGRGETSRS